jgi:signal transduction histidine kinase
LTRNALQQERVTLVNFTFNITQGEATLTCVSDGPVTDPATWQAGLGTTSIRRRVNDLGGHCEWISQAMGGVRFVARWRVAAWLEGDSLELGGSQAWAP